MKKSGNVNQFTGAFVAGAVNSRPESSFRVFNEVVFLVSKRILIPSADEVDLVIDTTLVPGIMSAFPVSFTATVGGPVFVDLHTDVVYTKASGTKIVPANRFLASVNPALTHVEYGSTVASSVKTPVEFMVPSDGTGAVSKSGGEAKDDLIVVFDTAKVNLLKIMNQDAVDDTTVLVSFSFFELPAF